MAAKKRRARKAADGTDRTGRRGDWRRHPGVQLLKLADGKYQLRWVPADEKHKNPNSKRFKRETVWGTREQCLQEAVRKSEEIRKRADELRAGAKPLTGTSIADALQVYFDDPGTRTSEPSKATLQVYRAAADRLEAFCADRGILTADELDGQALTAFVDWLRSAKKKAPVQGSKGKGRYADSRKKRSAGSTNQTIRSVRTILNKLRKKGLLPRLTKDEIADNLEQLGDPQQKIVVLMPSDLQKLLEAAMRHDAERVPASEARAERMLRFGAQQRDAARPKRGTTMGDELVPRFSPIAPLLAALMLSGMRLGEAVGRPGERGLEWSQVDLDALDMAGNCVGAINLRGEDVKTGRDREIYLMSPALRDLFRAMKRASGGRGLVFESRYSANAAKRRLVEDYGAPAFKFKDLRSTAATYLAKAPGISDKEATAQLGHSLPTAERHYRGAMPPIPETITTLEQAMQVEPQLKALIASLGAESSADNVVPIGGAR